MKARINWPSILITLLALAIVYGIGSAFFVVELERLIERSITPHIVSSPGVAALAQEIYSGIDQFMTSNHIRVIGFSSIAVIIIIALTGLLSKKRFLTSLGSLGFILPIYAYFVLHMSFLAGLGVITALWTPFWGNLVKLGDIFYLPYMVLVYPFSLAGIDARSQVAGMFIGLGLLIFILGVFAWFYARLQKKKTADFWIYRFTRHPQYLGWIVWSYGLMLRVGLRHDTALQNSNPGASLPWVISTLLIVCVALSEEIQMWKKDSLVYGNYSNSTPFLFPAPGFINRLMSAPLRFILKKERPETRWDVFWTFFIYLGLIIILSLPFVLLNWPAEGGWSTWPF
jgi:protein-S-isoprenylcysteine O-methyltransferase Ste14